jgi:hypothetical protein
MEGAPELIRGRKCGERLDQPTSPLGEVGDDLGERALLMALGGEREAARIGGRVDLTPVQQVVESLLPQVLDIGEMPDVLGDRPRPFQLATGEFSRKPLHEPRDPRRQAA